jgi:hypothetical protein
MMHDVFLKFCPPTNENSISDMMEGTEFQLPLHDGGDSYRYLE